ncbi:MAG: HNH endonuclease [Planctomycetota bacterium]
MRRFANKQEKAYLYVLQDGLCTTCGRDLDDWQADHIVPWVSGGSTNLRNLQLLCPQCHHKKTVADLLLVKVSRN